MRSVSTPVRPATFFALTYLLSWLIWIPLALSHLGIGPLRIPEETSGGVRLLGVLMPATAALILTALAGGRAALRALLGRLAIWRVNWKWWVAAVLVQPLLLGLVALVYNLLGGQPALTALPAVSAGALAVIIFFLLLATLGEEIGWHGVALPGLQQRYSALASTAILALLWAAWHLPFWLLMDTFTQYGIGYLALNFLFVFPLTVYVNWIFNHTRGSILLAAAFHVSFNIVNVAWLPVTVNIGAFALLIAAEWLIALWLLPRLE
jgi:membrane protease YdiL (CAAX protease family)